jgi:hypothetical protein
VSSEIERELERLFAQLPDPDPDVTERALAEVLAALPKGTALPRRRLGTLAVALATAVALLAVAAGALAAAGALHVSFGQLSHPAKTHPAIAPPSELSVPRGADAIAAIVGGRLWLTTSSGMRLQGLPVSAAALSPHALYVGVGIGDTLVAMAPDGRRAWSHSTAGSVRAIAWAPDGLRLAYVVENGQHYRLRVIEGNGSHDQLIDPAVRPVSPSWRADSLAFAYVAAGGRPVVYDLGHRSRTVITSPAAKDATRLAFAPSGPTLAIGTRNGFLLTGTDARPNGGSFKPSIIAGLGWLNGQLAVAINPAYSGDQGPFVQLFQIDHGAAVPMGQLIPPAPIRALDASRGRLLIAVAAASAVRVLASSPGTPVKKIQLPQPQVVLTLAPPRTITSLAVGQR